MPTVTTALVAAAAGVAPTSTISAFTANPSCNQGFISMLGEFQNEVWYNYPFPASAIVATGCYPESLLASLATPFSLPPLNPLVIPDWYTVVSEYTSNYFVACPLAYTLHLDGDGAPSNRPASGATCYSNLLNPTSVVAYNDVGITATQVYSNPTAQAFALVLDGYSSASVASGLTLPTNTNAPSPSPSTAGGNGISPSVTGTPAPSKNLSAGAITGTVIGVLAFVAILGTVALTLLRRQQSATATATAAAANPKTGHEPPPGYYSQAGSPHTYILEMSAVEGAIAKVHELESEVKLPNSGLSEGVKVTDETLELP